MAVTLDYTNLVEITNADTTTSWTFRGATTTVQDADTFIEGVRSISGKTSNVGVDGWVYDTAAANIDVTNKHLMVWINSFAIISTETLGGIRIRVEGSAGSATADYGEWYVSGSDTYIGGWQQFVVDCNRSFDASSATPPSKTAIQKVGATMNQTVALMALAQSFYVDAVTLCSGPLLVKGGTSGIPGTLDAIITADNANQQTGVVRKINGVYLLHAPITFGDSTSTTSTYFSDKDATLIWRNAKVASNFYDISVVGNSTGTNEFQLGNVSGSGASAIGTSSVSINAAPVISTGSYTYNENGVSADTITRSAGSFIIDGLLAGMIITVTDTASNNGSYTIDSIAAATITLITTDDLVAEGPVTSTLSGKRLHTFTASNANVNSIKIYNTTIANGGAITLGSTSTAIGGSGKTIHLIDNTIAKPTSQVRNIDTASTLNILRNKITFATTSTASLDLIDGRDTPLTEWQIVGDTSAGPGFQKSTSGTVTRNISSHNFGQMKKPYITAIADQTWNSINPTWTITNQTELDFIPDTASGASVDEKFSVSANVQQPDGTKLLNARVKIVEVNPTPAIANQADTDSGGDASFNTLTKHYVGAASGLLTTTTHSTFALKVYKYGKSPFAGSQTITTAVAPGITLLADTFQVETDEPTAVADGTAKVVIVESVALSQSHSIIKVTGITGFNFAAGDSLSGDTSGATGVIEQIIEGSGVVGNNATIIVKTRNSTAFSGTENISDTTSGGDATLVASSEKRFYWLVQAGTIGGTARTLQQLYDHFQAKLAEATLDTADNWDDVVLDGRAEYATPVQGVTLGSPNSFKTVRNAALTHGWVISGLLTLGGLNSYTANDNTSFTPGALVNVTVTIQNQAGAVIPGAEVAIFQDNAARTVVLASTTTNASGQVSTTVVASLGGIIIRARQSSNIASFNTTSGVNTTNETITTSANHTFQNGDSIVYSRNGGTFDIGPEPGTYFAGNVGSNTLMLYDTAANAIAGGATGKQDLLASGDGETHKLDPVRYVAGSATGTIGATNFSTQITMITDSTATG